MILAELPALRETLINGAGGIKGSTEGDLFRTNICLKKTEGKMSFCCEMSLILEMSCGL